jgi:hypothetical protein
LEKERMKGRVGVQEEEIKDLAGTVGLLKSEDQALKEKINHAETVVLKEEVDFFLERRVAFWGRRPKPYAREGTRFKAGSIHLRRVRGSN